MVFAHTHTHTRTRAHTPKQPKLEKKKGGEKLTLATLELCRGSFLPFRLFRATPLKIKDYFVQCGRNEARTFFKKNWFFFPCLVPTTLDTKKTGLVFGWDTSLVQNLFKKIFFWVQCGRNEAGTFFKKDSILFPLPRSYYTRHTKKQRSRFRMGHLPCSKLI